MNLAQSAVETFEQERSRLEGLAYRMLGSVADAEDVVQDAYLRWVGGHPDHPTHREVDNPGAFLSTIVTRLAIDRLRSARHQREQYVGPWLPEPLVPGRGPEPEIGPDDEVVLAESLTLGFLAVLERLGPVERAVFLLHDVFALPFAQVAEVVERSEQNCRQIARRSRTRINAERVRFVPQPAESEPLVDAFFAALVEGDVVGLEKLLSADVVHVSDGGADRHAARKPITGRARVARFLANIAGRAPAGTLVQRTTVNGEPGLLVTVDGEPFVVLTIRVVGEEIVGVWAVVNPTKLAHLGAADG